MKSTFLKVMGILLIVFGSLGIIGALPSAFVSGFYGILSLIGALIMLASGILGVLYSSKQEKAKICALMGIIMIAIVIIQIFLTAATFALLNAFGGISITILSIILSFVLPVLYFISSFLFITKKS